MKRTFTQLIACALALSLTPAWSQDVAAVKPAAVQSGTAPAVTPPSETETKLAEQLFEEGRKLFFQGQYAESIAKLAKAVETNPSKTSYKLQLAKAYRYNKQDDKALDVLQALVAGNPDHVEAAVELAELLSPQKQPDRVISVLQPLLKYKHDYPIYHMLAEAYYQKEQYDKARDHYEEAIKLNPRSGSDFYQLGNIYLAQKRFAKAAEVYERANLLGVSSGVFHFKLASVYFNLHNYLGTIGTSEVIGGVEGQLKGDLYLLSAVPGKKNTFYAAGPRSAAYQVVKAQDLGIDIFDIRFLEAQIWLSARRYDKADAIYAKLQADVKKEDQGLFWFQWAQTALGRNDLEQYLARLQKAIAADPDIYKPMLADAYLTIANRHHQRGETKEYLASLALGVATNPLSARLHLTLGDAYWQASLRDKAIEQYRLVLELEANHSQRVRLLNRIRGQEDIVGAATAAK